MSLADASACPFDGNDQEMDGGYMEKKVSARLKLKKPYIQVRRNSGELTYGGDQGFFRGGSGPDDTRKNAMGCGVIAFSDLLLYLGNRDPKKITAESESYVNRINGENAYKEYYNRIYDFLGGVSKRNGISGIKLAMKFNHLSKREKWNLRSFWGISSKKLYGRVEEMLSKDMPVILCIPMILFRKNKKEGLPFYRMENGKMQKAATVSAHYVMVTEIIEKSESDDPFFVISSWGKEYYVNWKEYETMMRRNFLGTILGNILYIR
ncbi:MAG: hypothetical protein K2N82_01615 [Lachnospiraceae bacterium]|nr:hypothetical protein [Lachnospiraceae bacterium]